MRLAIALVCLPTLAFASPKLVPVASDDEPIAFSAPVGWEIHIEPVRGKSMSVVASMSREPKGPDTCGDTTLAGYIAIALDQINATPEALLADQFPDTKPVKRHGWACIVTSGDVLCAGKLPGLDLVVSVDMSWGTDPVYKRMDPPEMVSRVAASLVWHGKVEDLHEWRRAGTKEACK